METTNNAQPGDVGAVKAAWFSGDCVRRKRFFLIAMLCYSVPSGALAVKIAEDGERLYFIASLPLLILMIKWCFEDARQRDYPLGKWMRVALVLFFIGAFPIYLFRTRGLFGFVSVLGAALFFCLLMLGSYAGEWIGMRIFC